MDPTISEGDFGEEHLTWHQASHWNIWTCTMNYIKRSSNARKSQTSTWNEVVLEQNDVFPAMPLLLPLVYGEGTWPFKLFRPCSASKAAKNLICVHLRWRVRKKVAFIVEGGVFPWLNLGPFKEVPKTLQERAAAAWPTAAWLQHRRRSSFINFPSFTMQFIFMVPSCDWDGWI